MFPQRKYIPDQYKEKCDFQSWEGVKVVPGLAEGRAVFSMKTFSRGSIICNYGGLNVTESYAEKHMLPYEEQCNYLVELREKTCDGASVKAFVNSYTPIDHVQCQISNQGLHGRNLFFQVFFWSRDLKCR